MRVFFFCVSASLVVSAASTRAGQDPPAKERSPDTIRKELKDARDRVAALEVELAKTEKPGEVVAIDWELAPASGDEDSKSKYAAFRKRYNGKDVTVTGHMSIKSLGGRKITAEVSVKVQRGEVMAKKVVSVVFQDTDQKKIEDAARAGEVTVAGKAEGGPTGFLTIQDCKIIAVVPAKK
ncbi:unnamed protein product [Gemmataceae bacterium]|nr:unnamed protein product [Gemmataceae bacterium]VTT97971.1 unnamed protein product [Gemmataceae bacterium]